MLRVAVVAGRGDAAAGDVSACGVGAEVSERKWKKRESTRLIEASIPMRYSFGVQMAKACNRSKASASLLDLGAAPAH